MNEFKVLKYNKKGFIDVILTSANGTKGSLQDYYRFDIQDGFKYLVFDIKEQNTIVDTVLNVFNNKYTNKDLNNIFYFMQYIGITSLTLNKLYFTCTLNYNYLGLNISTLDNKTVYDIDNNIIYQD